MRERWKVAREGVEIDPETVYLQGIGASLRAGDGVPIEEWANEFMRTARLIRDGG